MQIELLKCDTCRLIVVNTDPVQLQVTVSMIGTGGVDPVFIADHLPELRIGDRDLQ